MNLFAPPRQFDPNDREWIDQPGLDPALLREELKLLEEFNRRYGGHQLVLKYLQRLIPTPQQSLSILDLGTGSADIPRAVAAWARQRKISVTITAVDGNPVILEIAKDACRDWPEINFAQHDLRSLPFQRESFDIVLCSLALHHFDEGDAKAILKRIHELARGGYVVNDLRRNWLAIGSTKLLACSAAHSEIFRHDAQHSCRAAFTVGELRALVAQAGLDNFQINRHHWFFRMVLEGKK